MALQHLRSSTANKRPDPTAMAEGQLALNTANASPGLFYKDATGLLIKSGPVHIGATAPNATPAAGGHAGNSVGEAWLDTSGTNPLLKIYNGASFVTVQPVASGTVVSTADTGTVTSTMILDGTILNADINASAAIVDTKLATIATGGKVSNSATTATNANTASAIVARDASGNFTAGTITAALTGAASSNVLKAGDTMTGALVMDNQQQIRLRETTANGTNFIAIEAPASVTADRTLTLPDVTGTIVSTGDTGTVTSTMILDGTILNADINASAAIAGTKISPDFGSQTVTTTGVISSALGAAATPSITFTGDLNTGIYSPGADQVAVATNGTQRLSIGSTGSVNINSTLYIDAPNTRVGIGTASPSEKFDVVGNINLPNANSFIKGGGHNIVQVDATKTYLYGGTGGVQFRTADNLSALVDITNAGLVGIGTTSPSTALDVSGAISLGAVAIPSAGTARIFSRNTDNNLYIQTGSGSAINLLDASQNTMAVFEPTSVRFQISNSEKARLDASGRLLVGTSTARAFNTHNGSLQIDGDNYSESTVAIIANSNDADGAYLAFAKQRSGSSGGNTVVQNNDIIGELRFNAGDGTDCDSLAGLITCRVDGTPGANDMPGRLVFSTTADGASSPTERMRINSAGDVFIGTTTTNPGIGNTAAGVMIRGNDGSGPNYIAVSRSGLPSFFANRSADDGTIISLRQDGTEEGTISVSGTTVSYNGAHLSRWSQLPGGATRKEILRGTVLSNIDEMCTWGEEANEQLNRMKVSDVEGDKNVSGVFQAWDDDDDTYINDFYCAMTGDFIIRIAEGVTVERGDLLMSAGDGTAKPQDDDIIRSKTVAKVTSTNVSCTYEDGSYCVPCVLMAC